MRAQQNGYWVESKAMHIMQKLGLASVAWSLRRLHCPVEKSDLVLEVGSGGSPYYRANVLCDAYEETEERHFVPLVTDRPTVLAFVENLPFKDDAFDFVIASHVLEHSADPEKFLSELQRVAKAGYIEVPDAFMERLTHYDFHRLEITDDESGLIIRKKHNFIQDSEVVGLFERKAKSIFPKWVSRYPFNFHVRYYWAKDQGGIQYRILNPDCSSDWTAPMPQGGKSSRLSFIIPGIKAWMLQVARILFSQSDRNKSIKLVDLCKCNKCGNEKLILEVSSGALECHQCGNIIKIITPAGGE